MDGPNWEAFGAMKSLQNAQAAEEVKEQVKQLNDKIDAERRVRDSEQQRINSLPQCPYCGSRLEGQFEICNACTSPLIWVHGKVGKPDQKAVLEKGWQEEQARKKIAEQKEAKLQRSRQAELEMLKRSRQAELEMLKPVRFRALHHQVLSLTEKYAQKWKVFFWAGVVFAILCLVIAIVANVMNPQSIAAYYRLRVTSRLGFFGVFPSTGFAVVSYLKSKAASKTLALVDSAKCKSTGGLNSKSATVVCHNCQISVPAHPPIVAKVIYRDCCQITADPEVGCPKCGLRLIVPRSQAGGDGKCECGQVFSIPRE
jgi:DNA-directed RNA polymerase subunit RPC12/RpoP